MNAIAVNITEISANPISPQTNEASEANFLGRLITGVSSTISQVASRVNSFVNEVNNGHPYSTYSVFSDDS